jgi:hypothetical protein
MPIVTTPGDPMANSYASVAEADAYNAARPFGTAWASLTTEAKEGALQYAAILLDSTFIWTGVATANPGQVMGWPRNGMLTRTNMPSQNMRGWLQRPT